MYKYVTETGHPSVSPAPTVIISIRSSKKKLNWRHFNFENSLPELPPIPELFCLVNANLFVPNFWNFFFTHNWTASFGIVWLSSSRCWAPILFSLSGRLIMIEPIRRALLSFSVGLVVVGGGGETFFCVCGVVYHHTHKKCCNRPILNSLSLSFWFCSVVCLFFWRESLIRPWCVSLLLFSLQRLKGFFFFSLYPKKVAREKNITPSPKNWIFSLSPCCWCCCCCSPESHLFTHLFHRGAQIWISFSRVGWWGTEKSCAWAFGWKRFRSSSSSFFFRSKTWWTNPRVQQQQQQWKTVV